MAYDGITGMILWLSDQQTSTNSKENLRHLWMKNNTPFFVPFSLSNNEEVKIWIHKNLKGKYIYMSYEQRGFYFEHEEDALFFKLVWG